jgi:hypothetical protein
MTPEQKALAVQLGLDRVLAHQYLFRNRHRDKTPAFHSRMIRAWHGPSPRVLTMAFRGGAKSTIAEEAMIIRGLFMEFRNGLILGANIDLAVERLGAIKHEIEANEDLIRVFGELRGPIWGADEIVLTNGVRMLAMSRNQSIRGTKFRDQRPDGVFVDDIEDDEDSSDMLKATKRWFMMKLGPALDPDAFLRIAATPVHPECLAEDLRKDPDWDSLIFPIKYKDDAGEWQATWPDRFPLWNVEALEHSFNLKGMRREFDMEYMCVAKTEADIIFRESNFRTAGSGSIPPVVRSYHAVYGMFDPARTAKITSATTGFAAWSWIQNRLIVWESWARRLLPDEIIASMFAFCEEFDPVFCAVEEDGLNEFLLQPIRAEMVKRGYGIPLRAMKAPPGKMSFIRQLQPFFKAHEVIFAKDMPDLRAQLLSFPRGVIDAPNALAYALKMRPGAPMYDGFGAKHVVEGLMVAHGQPPYLCLNAGHGAVTAVLTQVVDGCVRVLGDYVREGDADEWVEKLVGLAQLDAGRAVRIVAGPTHFEKYSGSGLVQAVKRIPAALHKGVPPAAGLAHIRGLIGREYRGGPMLQVNGDAKWTLNAFSAGYSRALGKQGVLLDQAEENTYRVLMEGLESWAGLLLTGVMADRDDRTDAMAYATTPGGQRYATTLRR